MIGILRKYSLEPIFVDQVKPWDWDESVALVDTSYQSCFRLSLKHFLFVNIKCEALTFHVDCSVEPTKGSIYLKLHGVRLQRDGMDVLLAPGLDLSQPT